MNARKRPDQNTKDCTDQVAKDTWLSKVFKLVSRLSNIIPDKPWREIHVKGI